MRQLWQRLKIWYSNPEENLWVHPTLGALFAVFFSVIAIFSSRFIDENVVPIKEETLSDLLNIITSSMLGVTTFSLSIMVSALASTSNNVTPRARNLVMADGSTRLAITSFISAFIYAIIAKIGLSLKYYGPQGRLVMFISTLLVLGYLILTLIRWVQRLSNLGSLNDTIIKIEKAATDSLANFRANPTWGACGVRPRQEATFVLRSNQTGYLTHINLPHLQDWAQRHGCHLHIRQVFGALISPKSVLLEIYASPDAGNETGPNEAEITRLHEAFFIGNTRTYLQDPAFGLLTLTEVAQRDRANDTGTAHNALTIITRILVDTKAADGKLEYPDLSMHSIRWDDMLLPVFETLTHRDSLNHVEVNVHMLHCLHIIAHHAPEAELRESALRTARAVYHRARATMEYKPDIEFLDAQWQKLFEQPHED